MQALRFLLSRWVLSFVGIAILALLVWLFGPLLPSFESWVPRLAVVVGLLLTWATSNLLLDLLHRRREQKLESGVAEKTPEKADDGAGEEAAALRERMSTALALLIPVALAGVMIAGRGAALLVLGVIAAGQVALAGVLDGVAIGHLSTPLSTFAAGAPSGSLAKASAQSSLLYICGSLPLFLGGELATPAKTIRRGLIAAYGLAALVVLLAVAPLAAAPGLTRTAIPGVSLAQEFGGPSLAEAIGIGVAVSIAGVILCEYLALTRLVHAIGGWRMRPVTIAIGAVMVLAAPITLIDPQGFYSTLLEPSLIALWLSQLIVFAVYPSFARKHGNRLAPAWALAAVAVGLALYGLWTAIQSATS